MNKVRKPQNSVIDLVPYDPKYLPAEAFLSANESPVDISSDIRKEILKRLADLALNRYPDPLANNLRQCIAEGYGLTREQVLVGNGGDELLFNIALAWGGVGRTFLNCPPTFSVYAHNAHLTGTDIVDVARQEDFTLNEQGIRDRVSQGDIDFTIITSPNNPSGDSAREDFILELLETSDTLVVVDEAYAEFSQRSIVPYLRDHRNLVVLRTFSKAYRLAGVRLGYVLAHEEVIRELIKVRQPYSVDSVSQIIGLSVFAHRDEFVSAIEETIQERNRLYEELEKLDELTVYPSEANYLLIRIKRAQEVWAYLYERGVLVRDFSQASGLTDCLRVTVGSPTENDRFLQEIKKAITEMSFGV